MQKISLKPVAQELVYKGEEPFSFYDAFSYTGSNAQEKGLGSLVVVGNVKFDETEDLSYVVNLLSSLAKREYYSETSIKEQDPKAAFQRTLTKLNEVLEDFFENKKFSTDVGLAVIAGENIYISKLGKFKVALARNEEYIDVLNNIGLFEKSDRSEERFSNIVSGTLQPGDRVLAYIPFRPVTLREKKLNNVFVFDSPTEYQATLAGLAEGPKAFQFCGAYLQLDEVKEIPAGAAPSYRVMQYSPKAQLAGQQDDDQSDESDSDSPIDDMNDDDTVSTPGNESDETFAIPAVKKVRPVMLQEDEEDQPAARAIPSDMTMGRRSGVFSSIGKLASTFSALRTPTGPGRKRAYLIIAVIIIVPLLAFVLTRSTPHEPSAYEMAYAEASQAYTDAQTSLSQNDTRNARELLRSALGAIGSFTEKKEAIALSDQIKQQLRELDNIKSVEPTLLYDVSTAHAGSPLLQISQLSGDVFAVDQAGTLFELQSDNSQSRHAFSATPRFLYTTEERVAFLTTASSVAVYNRETKNTGVFELDTTPDTIMDADIFADNLYAISADSIYRYSNVTTGGDAFTTWLESASPLAPFISIAVDGNIYALSDDGIIGTYYKGAFESDFDTNLDIDSSMKLLTTEDGNNLYLFSPQDQLLYVYGKDSETLQYSIDLSELGFVQDAVATQDGVLVLSQNKVWSYDLQ